MREAKPVAGRSMVFAAAALWSLSGVFAKVSWLEAWPTEQRGLLIAFWRTLFAGLILLPFARRVTWRPGMIASATSFTLMNVSFMGAMTLTTAANAIWLQYTAPLWTIFFGWLLLREVPTARDLVMFGCGIAGVVIILTFELGSSAASAVNRYGVLLALVSGIGFSAVVLSLRSLRHEDPTWITSWNLLATAAILAPTVLTRIAFPSLAQLLWLAAFGIVQMGVPYVLFSRGLRTTPAHEASMISLLEPLLVPVWVLLCWPRLRATELPAWWTVAGGTCILVGLILRYGTTWKRRAVVFSDACS